MRGFSAEVHRELADGGDFGGLDYYDILATLPRTISILKSHARRERLLEVFEECRGRADALGDGCLVDHYDNEYRDAPCWASELAERLRALAVTAALAAADVAALGWIPPIVEPTTTPITIRFTAEARATLRRATAVSADGLEWGGYLYGRRDVGWRREIRIEQVVGGGPNAERAGGAVTLDGEEWVAFHEVGPIEILGMWHTHSNDLGPSPLDLVTSRKLLEDLERRRWQSHYVELIAMPKGGTQLGRPDEWRRPQFEAYVLRRAERRSSDGMGLEFGKVICERAQIEEGT